MPRLSKVPKDTVWLEANNDVDFHKWADEWQRRDKLLGKDFEDGLFSAIAIFDSRVVVLVWQDPNYKPPELPAVEVASETMTEAEAPLSQDELDELEGKRTEEEVHRHLMSL